MNFVETKFMKRKETCDEIIDWFESNSWKHNDGACGSVSGAKVDKEIKDTTDVSLSLFDFRARIIQEDFFKEMSLELCNMHREYQKKYFSLSFSEEYNLLSVFNIQRYKDGQHFSKLHYESSNICSRNRILTWMIYLNDVEESGKTIFPYQKLKISPEKGKMLIWPAEFTHVHCGEPVTGDEVKYIATGWFGIPKYVFDGVNDSPSYVKFKR